MENNTNTGIKKIPVEVTADEQAAIDWIRISCRRMDFVQYLRNTRPTASRQLTYDAFSGRLPDTTLLRWVRSSAVEYQRSIIGLVPEVANEQPTAAQPAG